MRMQQPEGAEPAEKDSGGTPRYYGRYGHYRRVFLRSLLIKGLQPCICSNLGTDTRVGLYKFILHTLNL